MEVKDMKIERCHICFIGFLDIGELTSEIRLINHLNMLHNTKCRECGLNIISEIHLRYHLKYTHDIECMHCNTYCGGTCSEKYGRAMSMDKQNQIAKIEIIKETEAELGEENRCKAPQRVGTYCKQHRHWQW